MESSDLKWIYDLYRLGQKAASTKPGQLYHSLLTHIVGGLRAASGSLALMSDDAEALVIVAGIDLPREAIGRRVALTQGIMGTVARSGEPLLLNGDMRRDGRFQDLKQREGERPRSAMCWPLKVESGVIGVLSVNRRPDDSPFTEQDLAGGQEVVDLVSLAVENTRLVRQARVREQMLRQSQARFQGVLNAAKDAILATDEERRIVLFNRHAESVFGISGAEAMGLTLDALLPDLEALERSERICLVERSAERPLELEGIRPDGVRFPAEVTISSIEMGAQTLCTAVVRDVSERKAMEESREQIRAFLQSITDAMGEGVYVDDAGGAITFINPEALHLLGWYEEDLLGGNSHALVHSRRPDGTVMPAEQSPVVQAQRELRTYRSDDDLYARNDGSLLPVAVAVTPLFDDSGYVGSVTVFRDISERKRAEAEQRSLIKKLQETHSQLLQSEKMASIGQLAAGVAHEINNPIGYVFSNLGSLQDYIGTLLGLLDVYARLEAEVPVTIPIVAEVRAAREAADLEFLKEDLESLVKELREGLTRVKQIVSDLKDFSRVDAAEWHWSNLEQGLDSTLNIARNEIKYKAEVIREYAGIPEVKCAGSQLNQVFMNLMVNAAQAIEGQGTITLRTAQGAKGWVWIEVEDTGKGISPDHLNRIFDPFFTTKPVGKGTGLGLSLSYGIVERHGGRIEVESKVGAGTRFRVHLPVDGRPAEGRAVAA